MQSMASLSDLKLDYCAIYNASLYLYFSNGIILVIEGSIFHVREYFHRTLHSIAIFDIASFPAIF